MDINNKDLKEPSPLPIGRTEFDTWATEIITLAGAPDNDSVRFALATMIMQFPPSRFLIPKLEIIHMLQKGMANQVASAVYAELKQKQLDEEKKRKEEAEAAAAVVVS